MRAIAASLCFAILASAAPVPKGAVRPDAERFVGAWESVVSETNGKPFTKAHWTFDEKLNMTSDAPNGTSTKWTIKLDPKKTPREIDITNYKGIYEFDGEDIKVAYVISGDRPTDFTAAPGKYYCLLRRVAEDKK